MRSGALLALLAVLCACADRSGSSQPAAPPGGPPYIEGRVEDVTAFTPVTEGCLDTEALEPDRPASSSDPPLCSTGAEGPGTIHVAESEGGNEAVITIAPETLLFGELGGGVEPTDFASLQVGQTVAVWVSGPVAESFPVQATADAVVIRE